MPSFEPPEVPQPKRQPPPQRGPQNVDDIVVGKGHGDTSIPEYADGGDQNVAVNVDQLTPENRKSAAELIDAFGEETVAKLFSSAWQTREDALN